MSHPRVVALTDGSPASRAGILPGDEIVTMNGTRPRDVIEYRYLAEPALVSLEIERGGLGLSIDVAKRDGEPLGIEVHSSLFDQVRTCDNHCEFCFIYQLPPGLRPSLYVKDDDYRLSFLYGNYTTLTRFTEIDLERVVTERLSPLNVSIHATDPDVRADLLRNRRGATSLRWLRALLDHDIEVHGQVVVCPGVNDGAVLHDTFAGVLDRFPELASLCVVPLGVSRHTSEGRLRPHTRNEAEAVVDAIHEWQEVYLATLGRRLTFAADEYYLLTDRPFPEADAYEGFGMHEDGVGMARTFQLEFDGEVDRPTGVQPGFFSWVDGAPAEGYRATRVEIGPAAVDDRSTTVLTSTYGARVLGPLVAEAGLDARVLAVENRFFGGNIGVAGLLTGEDLSRALTDQPPEGRYLLPDVCLSEGRFLDGTTIDDLPRAVTVLPTDGVALRAALDR